MSAYIGIQRVIQQGSWLLEIFEDPEGDILDHYIQEAIQVCEKANKHEVEQLQLPEPYDEEYMKALHLYLACNNLEYKQYALLGFLHSNEGMQEYVKGREKGDFQTFMNHLKINTEVYICGLQYNGKKFKFSTKVRDRRIYGYVQIMRDLALQCAW